MRILYIANIRLPTEKAHGLQIMKTCEAFVQEGASVTLVVPRRTNILKDEPFAYYGIDAQFPIVYLPTLDWVRFGRVGFLIETGIFSLCALWYVFFKSADSIFSRDEAVLWPISFFKKNIVWESHDGRLNGAARRVLTVAKRIIVTTTGIYNNYASSGVRSEKMLLAQNGVDLNTFTADAALVEKVRAKLISGYKYLIIYAGRLDGWKGVSTLLEASSLLPSEARVVIIGGEPAQVSAMKIEYPHITFLGFIPYRDVGAYQQAADVLVLPNTGKDKTSVDSTSPLKLFTYMAAGRPIVASDLPSIRSVLNDDTCYFATPDSPESFAAQIQKAYTDTDESERKAKAARLLVEDFTWKARAKKILKII